MRHSSDCSSAPQYFSDFCAGPSQRPSTRGGQNGLSLSPFARRIVYAAVNRLIKIVRPHTALGVTARFTPLRFTQLDIQLHA